MAPVDATLAALTADPARTALLLDYDGSLSPIVAHPEEAAPLPGTAAVLDAIAARLALVAIVSGRPLDFLRHALPTRQVALVGQYGLEWVDDGQVVVDERALPYVDAVAAAGDELERRWPDLYIERKGAVAVTAHWRMAPETGDEVVREIDALARRLGLEVHPSRKARELRPPLGVDKGAAVERLLARVPNVSAAAFAGDDAGDLPAFAALERLRADGRLERVARIAVSSPEVPEAVVAGGDVVVDGPKGLRELLDALASRLGEQVP